MKLTECAGKSHVYDLGSEWRGLNARYAVRFIQRILEAGGFVIFNLFYCMCMCVCVCGVRQFTGAASIWAARNAICSPSFLYAFSHHPGRRCACVFVETNRIALGASWNGCSQDRWEGG